MNYKNQMQIGTQILKIINSHLDEVPECKHSIAEILNEALSLNNNKNGVFAQPQATPTNINTSQRQNNQRRNQD